MAQADFWVRLIQKKGETKNDVWSENFAATARNDYQKWSVYK
jgi:hypothetical protein